MTCSDIGIVYLERVPILEVFLKAVYENFVVTWESVYMESSAVSGILESSFFAQWITMISEIL